MYDDVSLCYDSRSSWQLFVVFRFTKNLAADKISLSTLKGEGDLSDLELDELVLTDLLDLPTWIRLTKATCNRLTIKVKRRLALYLCIRTHTTGLDTVAKRLRFACD